MTNRKSLCKLQSKGIDKHIKLYTKVFEQKCCQKGKIVKPLWIT